MARARAYSRYLFRNKHRKQYTMTRGKLIVGFFLSLLSSIFLGSYFEKYGPLLIEQLEFALSDTE
jgi:hypothetical protein